MNRWVLKPFTFSNGVTVPAGTMISCAALPTHHDENNYADAETFNPWRFSDMREEEGESIKHQMVYTGPNLVSFGHGRHAWCVLSAT
jgi:cytochrome P450